MNIRTKGWIAPLLLVIVVPLQPDAKAEDLTPRSTDVIGEVLGPAELGEYRGGEIVKKLNINELNAYSSGNQVLGETTTGSNAIDSAFNGLNGIASVVQNSGNNVIIQGSTIINVEFVGAAQTP
jgi:hypothetical protein